MRNLKYLFLLALTIVGVNVGFAQGKAGGYTITGVVKGIKDGPVELTEYNFRGRTTKTVNTAILKDGKFVMEGKLDAPALMGLKFTAGNWGTSIFLENSVVNITVDTAGATHYDYTAYGMGKGANLKEVQVTGSESHKAQAAYLQFLKTLNPKERAAYKAAQLDYISKLINSNPSSAVGVHLFSDYYQFNTTMPLKDIEALMAKFTGDAKKSINYRNLQLEIAELKAVLPGQLAEDFTLLKKDSTKFTLSSTRGKYVMIDFWASWCKPCREAIPHWKEVYAKYKDKGFDIVSVTNDIKRAEWIKAMDVEQMPWTQVIDEFPVKNMPARVLSKYKHGTIPLYVLLDKQGVILAKTGDEAEIDRILAEKLK